MALKNLSKALNLMLLLSLPTILLAQVGIADRGERNYLNMNEQKIHSAIDEITVNAKGDTVLVSRFDQNNVRLQVNNSLYRTYLGTPFFQNGWYSGTLTYQGSDPVKGTLAYNLVNGQVYYSHNPQAEAIVAHPKEFELKGVKFVNFEGEYNLAGKEYYQILYDGEPRLIKEYKGRMLKNNTENSDGYSFQKPEDYAGVFQKFNKYYFVVQKQLVLVSSKGKFLSGLGPYAQAAKAFVHTEKLDLKKESDIIKLAQHLSPAQ